MCISRMANNTWIIYGAMENTTSDQLPSIVSMPEIWTYMYYLYVIGVIGNALVIIYFLKNNGKPLRHLSSYHLLIVQLAIVDFIICLMLSVGNWDATIFQPVPVYLVWTVVDTLTSLSCLFIILLAFERYKRIVHPFETRIHKKTFLVISLAATILLFVVYYLFLGYLEQITIIPERVLMHVVMECIVPVLLMSYFYIEIRRGIYSLKIVTNAGACNKRQLKKKKKALDTLKFLNLMYVLCIIPARILNLSIRFTDMFHEIPSKYFFALNHAYNFTNFSFCVNNMINVFGYAKIMTDFRRYLTRIFTCNFITSNVTPKIHHTNSKTHIMGGWEIQNEKCHCNNVSVIGFHYIDRLEL